MNQSQPQREWTFVTASTPAQFQGPSTQFLVKSAAKRNYIRSRDRRPRHPPRSIASLPRNHITDETTRLETKSYRSTHTPVRRDLAAPSAPSLDTLEEPEQEPETNNVKNLVSDEHTYEIVQIHYGTGSSSSVTSASFVPDWMLGAHVWRTEDAMAAFNLPQKYHAYYSDVVNHYLTVIVPVWIPFDENGPSNFVDNHIKACMGSALLLQVLAAFSLTHQDCLRRQPLGHRARVHRGEAVKLVNHKLSSGMVEDSTILAVGIMCITSATLAADSIQQTPEHLKEVEIHMNGVEAMVKLRGGIYNLGMNGALNEIVCWLDRIVAELTSKPPRFAPPPGNQPTPLVDIPEYALDLTSPIPWSIFMLVPQTTEPNRSILGILSQLARLTSVQADLTKATDILKCSIFEESAFEERLTAMEQHLNTYIAKAVSTGNLDRAALMREASCISGSIYTHLQFRDAEPANVAMQALKDRLFYLLNNLDTDTIVPHRLDTEGPFLLWILFCGGILCMTSDERSFFVNRIASLMLKVGIQRWEEVDGILKGYLWTEKLCTRTCWMLWEEVRQSVIASF